MAVRLQKASTPFFVEAGIERISPVLKARLRYRLKASANESLLNSMFTATPHSSGITHDLMKCPVNQTTDPVTPRAFSPIQRLVGVT